MQADLKETCAIERALDLALTSPLNHATPDNRQPAENASGQPRAPAAKRKRANTGPSGAPRSSGPEQPQTVFETAAFDRSATPPRSA